MKRQSERRQAINQSSNAPALSDRSVSSGELEAAADSSDRAPETAVSAAVETTASGSGDFWHRPSQVSELEAASEDQLDKGKSAELGQVVIRPADYNALYDAGSDSANRGPSGAAGLAASSSVKADATPRLSGGSADAEYSEGSPAQDNSQAKNEVKKQALRSFWSGKRPNAGAPSANGAAAAFHSGGAGNTPSAPASEPTSPVPERRAAVRGRNVWAELAAKRQREQGSASAQAQPLAEAADSADVPASEPASPAPERRAAVRGRNVWAELAAKRQREQGSASAQAQPLAEAADSAAAPDSEPALPAPVRRAAVRGRNVWAELEAKRQKEQESASVAAQSSAALADTVSASALPGSEQPLSRGFAERGSADSSAAEKKSAPHSEPPLNSAQPLPYVAPSPDDVPTMAEDSDSVSSDCAVPCVSDREGLETKIRTADRQSDEFNEELTPLAITEEDYNDDDPVDAASEPLAPSPAERHLPKGLGPSRMDNGSGRFPLSFSDRLGLPKMLNLGKASGSRFSQDQLLPKPLLKKRDDQRRSEGSSDPVLPGYLSLPSESKKPFSLSLADLPFGKHHDSEKQSAGVLRTEPVPASLPAPTGISLGKNTLQISKHTDAQISASDGANEKREESGGHQQPSVPKMLSIGHAKSGGDSGPYRLPSISLLDKPDRSVFEADEEDQSELLIDALASFKVQATVVNVVHGPAVTRYEVEPARGVSVKKFMSLRDDLALCMAAKTLRMEAPVPGKSVVGIEVPNKHVEMVSLYDVIASDAYRGGKGLCFGLGKDIAGNVQVADLGKMPHLLIAGTTGSGKSVCINTIILSLIYRFKPTDMQILMIDPKQVELSIYEGIPHLIGLAGDDAKIVCDPKKAAIALNQMVMLMEDRYALFAKNKVRKLKEYNEQAETKLPWVVVIIDELADLVMVAQKPVETAIARLAQKARAAGILMVVATQRPSADVLTGIIRSNIPSRISFAVPTQIESRIILDAVGAEDLLGKGDMLFKPLDEPSGIRIQGAFVSNEEIERVVKFWSQQATPENRIEIDIQEEPEASDDESSDSDCGNDADEDMIQTILSDISNGQIRREKGLSASSLQSVYRIGYARARRLVEQMEKRGYLGPSSGSKPREILYDG